MPVLVFVFLFSVAVLTCVFGLSLYIDRAAKHASRARVAEMERRREEANAYWAPRIQAALEREAAQQTTVIAVAPVPEAEHNAGRRRIQKLD